MSKLQQHSCSELKEQSQSLYKYSYYMMIAACPYKSFGSVDEVLQLKLNKLNFKEVNKKYEELN